MCVLVSVLYLQGPTTSNSAMPRCNSSGMTTYTMHITVICALNADFSKQISNAVKFSSYLGHAVSVQTLSGDILGCGKFESHFPVNAEYNGHIVLEQYSRYHLTMIMRTSSKMKNFQKTQSCHQAATPPLRLKVNLICQVENCSARISIGLSAVFMMDGGWNVALNQLGMCLGIWK